MQQSLGRYTLYGEIASGGLATVYFGALHGSAGFTRVVAVKRLLPHLADDPGFAVMLLDEARVASRIRHPSVVSVFDVSRDDDDLLLVMEYVHGDTLAKLIAASKARQAPVPAKVATSIMAATLHGLHAAHAVTDSLGNSIQLVHRDVSPQNVLVGLDGIARITDFGIAKALGRLQNTSAGVVKGKLGYMAPEQLLQGIADRRTDVYAASVVLWEALTSRRLFGGKNHGEIMHAILNATVDRPSVHMHAPSPALDEIVMTGLSRNPADRFDSAQEMAIEIESKYGVASPARVGAWVEDLVGEVLRGREQQLLAIERGSIVPSLRPNAMSNLPAEPSDQPFQEEHRDRPTVPEGSAGPTSAAQARVETRSTDQRRIPQRKNGYGAAAALIGAGVVALVVVILGGLVVWVLYSAGFRPF